MSGREDHVGFSAPVLKSPGREKNLNFQREYEQYKRKLDRYNQGRADAQEATLMRLCFDPSLLMGLIAAGELENADSSDNVTSEEAIATWMNERVKVPAESVPERLATALKTVEYERLQGDARGTALTLHVALNTALKNASCLELLSEQQDQAKVVLGMVLNKLPKDLRELMTASRVLWSRTEQRSAKHFFAVLTSILSSLDITSVGKRKREEIEPEEKSRNQRRKEEWKCKQEEKRKKAARDNDKKGADVKPDSKVWTLKCLNPKCDGIHRIRDCPITSKEYAKELWERHRKAKRLASMRSFTEHQENVDDIYGDDGIWRLGLYERGKSEVKYRFLIREDTGADEGALDAEMFQKIVDAGIKLDVTKLETPVELELAVYKDRNHKDTYTATRTMLIDFELISHAGPVAMRGITFYIVDQHMPSPLLGRAAVKRVGYDLATFLSTHREALNAASEVMRAQSLKGKHGNLLYSDGSGLNYDSANDDPIQMLDSPDATPMTASDQHDLTQALTRIVQKCADNGMSPNGVKSVEQLLEQHRKVFRLRMTDDPPAKLEPLRIVTTPNARPHRAPQRRYAVPQREFLNAKVEELVKNHALYANPHAHWSSPALAVLKPSSKTEFRFTVDLRRPNSETIPIASSMPNIESLLQTVEGHSYFAEIDFIDAYWQCALHPDSQEMLSIQTPSGVYSPTRLLQGGTDSGNHFQAETAKVFTDLSSSLLQWMDDFCIHAATERDLIECIATCLHLCDIHGLKVHARKTKLFARTGRFCGRILDKDGFQYDPRHVNALTGMLTPETAGDLMQFVHATSWMRSSIPDFASHVAPLRALLEHVYTAVGSRLRRRVTNFALRALWGPTHTVAFATIKQLLGLSLKLAFPKPGHTQCLYTDASRTHWSAVLRQVPSDQMGLPHDQRDHLPMAFLSGAFTHASENWSVPEKEGFAIVTSMTRLDHLIVGHTVRIFTDHATLKHLYNPRGTNPSIATHVAAKLLRWALRLSGYAYVIEHITGEQNIWADLLTRWAARPRSRVSMNRINLSSMMMIAPISPQKDFDWPSRRDVVQSQNAAEESPPIDYTLSDSLWKKDEVTWIPKNDRKLQLRIVIAAHCGSGGHRGVKATSTVLREAFWWSTIMADTKQFVSQCLHCVSTSVGERVARPLGHAVHADKPNKLLHFDYLHIGKSAKGFIYVLILKDDLSSYVRLVPCHAADALTTAEALIAWFADYGTVLEWMSDQGTHFKNEVVRSLRDQTYGSHAFSLAYCPWSNGSVEVVCREVIRASRALTSEFQIRANEWHLVLPIVQSVLNMTPLARLGNRSPLMVFSGGALGASPLLSIVRNEGKTKVTSIEEVRARQIMHIEDLASSIEGMHREVAGLVSKTREKRVEMHNKRTGIRKINFTTGDFVLRGLLVRRQKTKLRWVGPYRVQECLSEFIFRVEDLLDGQTYDVHGSRLIFFRNAEYGITSEMREHLLYQAEEYAVVRCFTDIKCVPDGTLQLFAVRRGYEDSEASWEDYANMAQDVPVLVREYVAETREEGTPRQRMLCNSL